MKIGYLINMYPKISHSFIRREIAALEALRVQVTRFSIRRSGEQLVDEADLTEERKTHFILAKGFVGLLWATLRAAITRPVRISKATVLTLRIGWRSDRGLVRNLIYLAEACVLLQWLEQAKIQHLHAHFGTNSAAVAMMCHELGGPPYSFTVHGPAEFDRATVLALGEKIERASFVVAISEYCRGQLSRWCGHEHWPKIHVVHCGLDEPFLHGRLVAIPSAPKLLCVGRLCPEKGQLILIEAAAQLVSQKMEFELTLVGDGEMRQDLEALIARHQLGDRVKMTGWASGGQVRKHILASRVVVLPSFAEGLPVVIMEALALGRPVISTYVAGIPELVQHRANGWLIPAGSVAALTDAMREALTTCPDGLAEMGKVGMAIARQRHDAYKEATKLADLLNQSAVPRKKSSPSHRTNDENQPMTAPARI